MISEPFVLARPEQRRIAGAIRRAFPREACGLLFARTGSPRALVAVPTAPTRNTATSFTIRARDIAHLREEREELGEVMIGCFHSHLIGNARPSPHDHAGACRLGGLWLIHSLASGRTALFDWNGAGFETRSLQLF